MFRLGYDSSVQCTLNSTIYGNDFYIRQLFGKSHTGLRYQYRIGTIHSLFYSSRYKACTCDNSGPQPLFPSFFLTLGHNNLTLLDIIHYKTLLNITQHYHSLHNLLTSRPAFTIHYHYFTIQQAHSLSTFTLHDSIHDMACPYGSRHNPMLPYSQGKFLIH
jgi:hypothetical protein